MSTAVEAPTPRPRALRVAVLEGFSLHADTAREQGEQVVAEDLQLRKVWHGRVVEHVPEVQPRHRVEVEQRECGRNP